MNPRFEIVRTDAGWHLRYVAANGEVVMTSEVYTRKQAAEEAIDLVGRLDNTVTTLVLEVDERMQG